MPNIRRDMKIKCQFASKPRSGPLPCAGGQRLGLRAFIHDAKVKKELLVRALRVVREPVAPTQTEVIEGPSRYQAKGKEMSNGFWDSRARNSLIGIRVLASMFALILGAPVEAAVPRVESFSPIPEIPVGAPFAGSLVVTDPTGTLITKLRVHVSATPGGSDCAIDIGAFNGTQVGGEKVFSGCAELSNQPGLFYLKVEGWNTGRTQAPPPNAVVRVGPDPNSGSTRQAATVSAGTNTTCAVDTAGTVTCWGGFAGGDVENPVAINGLPAAASVAVGNDFACALDRSGVARCWGGNAYGQLGNGTTTSASSPTLVSSAPAFAQIVAGSIFTCGLTKAAALGAGGAVYCWGNNNYGQLGTLSVSQSTLPLAIPVLTSGVGQISAGFGHVCAVLNDGSVKCWGNIQGISGTNGSQATPIQPAGTAKLVAIGGSEQGACGTDASGQLQCWGSDSASIKGALPSGTAGIASGALRVGPCVLSKSGKALCQGANSTAQIGNGHIDLGLSGTYPGEPSFQQVVTPSADKIIQLAQGSYGSCALGLSGRLYCWGYMARLTTPSTHYLYATTPYELPYFRTATQALPTPTIASVAVLGAEATLTIGDNGSATAPSASLIQTKCRVPGNTLAHGAVLAVPPAGRTLTAKMSLPAAGPWSCSVRILGSVDDGIWGIDTGAQSPWSSEVQVTKVPAAIPTIQSAQYDGTKATIVFSDNVPASDGPLLTKGWYCHSQYAPPGTTSDGFIYGTQYAIEPTAASHSMEFNLPSAPDWQCQANYSTYGGNSSYSAWSALSSTLAGIPTITSGRVAGNTGILTFADNQTAGGTSLDAIWQCARIRDGGQSSGVVTLAEALGGTHKIAFPLSSSDYLQNPDNYACKVRVRQGVLTSTDSAVFNIAPNQAPVVSGLTASVVNGQIQGQFVITDPDGDMVKNLIVRFANHPGASQCGTGYLIPPETLVTGGARSFKVGTNSCDELLGTETTIYAWVEAYDENGRQAPIVSVAFANTPSTNAVVPNPSVNSIAFENVPTTLKVDQSWDINLRLVDGAGNTVAGFNGRARISIDENMQWSMQNETGDTADQFRIVTFRNGLARIRAIRFHGEGVVTIKATTIVSLASAGSALATSNAMRSIRLLSSDASVSGHASLAVGTASHKVSLDFTGLTAANDADLASGRVQLFLVSTQNAIPLGTHSFTPNDGSYVQGNWATVPEGRYKVVARMNNHDLPGWSGEISVGSMDVSKSIGASAAPDWSNFGKKPVMLLHGIFGSSIPSGVGEPGPAPTMPSNYCDESDTQPASCSTLEFYKPFFFDDLSGWSTLRSELRSAGYYVVDVAYDWRVPRDVAVRPLTRRIAAAKLETGAQRVDIFAHSMGGLVALEYLALRNKSTAVTDIDRLIMVGTPLAGSVLAYDLMALGDPILADAHGGCEKDVAVYSSVTRQALADLGLAPWFKNFRSTVCGGLGLSALSYTTVIAKLPQFRRVTLANYVPSGWSLYPTTDAFANGNLALKDELAEYRTLKTQVGGFNPVLANAECISASASASRTSTPALGEKTRIFYLLGNAGSDTYTGITSSGKEEKGAGDGTVPFNMGSTGGVQLSELRGILNLVGSGTSLIDTCVFPGDYGSHMAMPGNQSVISKTKMVLGLPTTSLATISTQLGVVRAPYVPSLSYLVKGQKPFFLASAFGTIGTDIAGNVTSAAGGAKYMQESGMATASVSSPVAGTYTMTLRPSTSTARTMTNISANYNNGVTQLSVTYSFLFASASEVLTFAFSDATPSIMLTGRPVPVSQVKYRVVGSIATIVWTPPTDASITAYNVYARRANEDEWQLVASAGPSASSANIPIPPASNDAAEWSLVVVGVNAQGEGPIGDVDNNRLDDGTGLDFGSDLVVAPSTLGVSPAATAMNLVTQPFTIQGGEFSINGGAWSSGGGVLSYGDNIRLRATAPATPGAAQIIELTTNTDSSKFYVRALGRRLSVATAGEGTGTVTGGTISCGTTCEADFADGASATLSAQPNAGSTFLGWSGACSNASGPCIATMTSDKTVTATFALASGVCGSAAGAIVTGPPTSELCGVGDTSSAVSASISGYSWTCTGPNNGGKAYCFAPRGHLLTASAGPHGTVSPSSQMLGPVEVGTVKITPDTGYTALMTSTCGGTLAGNIFTVITDQDCAVVATFSNPAASQYALSVSKTGTGLGWVGSDVVGIDCGGNCAGSYPAGTTVTLSASPWSNTRFVGWSGACSGIGTCTVTMNSAISVAARFETTSATNSFGAAVGNTGLFWDTGGDAPWTIDSQILQSGTTSLRSGVIHDGQHSNLMTTVRGPGTLTFYWKVSSEANHDFLSVWLDFDKKAEISGEVDWTLVNVQIPGGQHDINWVYQKDATGSAGSDAGWVDSVTMVPFTDVGGSSWAASYINAIYSAGITTGCGPGNYCATQNVTRDQMAAFIIRAREGNPAAGYCGSTAPFADVLVSNTFCGYIKRMKELNVTTGCGGSNYCPTQSVTRDQMAAFIIRALEGNPAAGYCGATSPFADVQASSGFCGHIKRMLELNITTGCGGGNYCPAQTVTRDQMAVFLARAFLGM
jgi:alpha-tubulin suppressor-like RCC1 family protein/pimeloyl-ACP methyl ester carboxylesterase